jgi:Putative peptidoglycan binding domain
MRLIKGSLAGLILAGILAVAPTGAFARGGGGGGGHGGGGGGHGGGFGAGHGEGGHFGGFAGHGWHGRGYWGGGPFWGWDGDASWDDYPYYGYDDYSDGDYSDAQPSETARHQQTVVAVQKELEKLGYYHGQIDGIAGPATRKAISWFQSVDKLSVSGRIDDATLKALQIS